MGLEPGALEADSRGEATQCPYEGLLSFLCARLHLSLDYHISSRNTIKTIETLPQAPWPSALSRQAKYVFRTGDSAGQCQCHPSWKKDM